MPKWLYQPKGSPYLHYEFVLNGRRFFGSTKTGKLALARRFVERIRAEAIAGTLERRRPEMTVDHAFGRWFTEHGRHLKEADNFEARLGRLLDHLGKDTLLSEIGSDELAGYVARRRADFSPVTVNHDLRTLRRVLRRARLWKVALPAGIEWRDLFLPEPPPRDRHLSTDEEARLLAELPPDLAVLVRFAILTGARLDSLLRLRWVDVDVAASRLVLQDVKSIRPGEKHALPITAELRALLGGWRGQHPVFVFTYLCERTTRDRKGGVRQAGTRYPFSSTGWRRKWKRALAAAGIADLRFHDTRHTAGTRITKATGNLRVTQRTLGHRNITTTQRYAHVLLEDVAAGIEAASRNFPGSGTARVPALAVPVVVPTAYKDVEDDGQPAPKAGALPG
jgi:integrase